MKQNQDEESFHLGRSKGKGAEHEVRERGHSPDSVRLHESVLKIKRQGAALWKTETEEFTRHCIASLVKNGFRVPKIEVHSNPIVREKKGKRKRIKYLLEEPAIKNIDEKVLSYEDLIDPQHGPHLLKELLRYVRAADKARKEDKVGYDPLAGAIMVDALKGIFQRAALLTAKILPKKASKFIENRIHGIQAKVRNILIEEVDGVPELLCNDVGMHDFSERGKFKFLTAPTHYLAFGGLIQLIRGCNEELPKEVRIPSAEIDSLPYAQNFCTRFPAKLLWNILAPLFKRHKNKSSTFGK